MIFIYKSHLPSRVKCLMKMSKDLITLRNLKYQKASSISLLKPKDSSVNEQKYAFINSYNLSLEKETFLLENDIRYTIFLVWIFHYLLHKN